jgi:ABC-2 type transport system ATP-binding protein
MSENENDETNTAETNILETPPAETNGTAVPVPDELPPVPSPAVVVFQSVTSRDMAGPRRRARGTLNAVSFSLRTGVFAFVGSPEDGTFALVDVLTGARAPSRGRVLITGVSPERSGRLRARMGFLSPEPVLPAGRTVSDVVDSALQARGQTRTPHLEVLDPLGLAHLARRDPRSLSFLETRAVELAIALSTPSPVLVVLHEPLADVAINLLGLVRERIRLLAASGACVVITTSSPADARALADDVFVLHRGAIASETAATDVVPGSVSPLLVAWVRPMEPADGLAPVRRLARALATHPEISSVAWNDPSTGSSQASELRLSGTDIDACALALADAATEVGAIIEAILPASPSLTRLRAAAEAAEALRRTTAHQRPGASNVPAPGGGR